MNIEDFIVPPVPVSCKPWQIGSSLVQNIPDNGVVLVWISDYRGAGFGAESLDFREVRKQFYRLSRLDFSVPVCDLGDLISGKNPQDTHYILQEIVSACLYKNSIPVIIGGSQDLANALVSAVNFHKKNINYLHISNSVSFENAGEEMDEHNFLSRIFSSGAITLKNFSLLGYQKHLNETDSVKLIKDVDFDIVRLADMMHSTTRTEPYFRHADVVSVNCDAVESFSEAFSVNPQVNGLNRREICAYMKECGLSENLMATGIFNFDFTSSNFLNNQLLAQMLWYLLEGINIRKSHPEEKSFETFWVMVDDKEYAFKRDVFSNLWYFGTSDNAAECLPCSREEYEAAKRGILEPRLQKFLS